MRDDRPHLGGRVVTLVNPSSLFIGKFTQLDRLAAKFLPAGDLCGEVVLSLKTGGDFGFEVSSGVAVGGRFLCELVLEGWQLLGAEKDLHACLAEPLADVAGLLGRRAIGVLGECRQAGQGVCGDPDIV